jgi:hypothetical protein
MAWAILTSVYKVCVSVSPCVLHQQRVSCQVVKAQGERDAKVSELVQAMANASSHQIELLAKKSRNFETIAMKIAQKTVECASFIREYCEHKFSGM